MTTPQPAPWSQRILIGAGVFATFAICALIILYPAAKAQDEPKTEGSTLTHSSELTLEPEQEKALDVKTVKARLEVGDHILTLGARMSFDLEKTVRIRPLYNVTIYQVHKRMGETVKKGDPILTVESTDLGTAKNNYLQAIANLEVSATTYRREALLRLRHATTDVDYENARSGFRQASVALMASREQCLLMGVRPAELEELRKELTQEVLNIVDPQDTDGHTSKPSGNQLDIGSGGTYRLPGYEAGLGVDFAIPPDVASVPTSALALKPATDEKRYHDALVALAEISKRFATPRLANEEDGRRRARYTIRAPIDGMVVSKDCARGEFIDPTQVVVTVADVSVMWINLDIYQQQIASVEQGARVDVTTPAYPLEKFNGTITFVGAIVDDATHTLRARVEVDNAKGLLKSGLAARCEVHCVDHEPKLQLPREAILDDAGKTYAIVKKSPGHYERRSVTLGLKTDKVVQVEPNEDPMKTVKDGEEVVLEGNLYIHTTVPLGD